MTADRDVISSIERWKLEAPREEFGRCVCGASEEDHIYQGAVNGDGRLFSPCLITGCEDYQEQDHRPD